MILRPVTDRCNQCWKSFDDLVVDARSGCSLCPKCYKKLTAYREESEASRAFPSVRANQLRRSLTARQWKRTVDHFDGLCAYCGVKAYAVLEHATPMCRGGGTTILNCLPACVSCNARKRILTIEELPATPQV